MFVGLFAALAGVSFAGVAQAQQTAWGQCGGNGWTGKTTCISGYYCSVLNPWYSQCIPGSAGPSTSSSTSRSVTSVVDTWSVSTSTRTVIDTSSTPTISSSTPTITGGQSTNPSSGKQIRTVVDPVYHLYLQLVNGKPQLGPESKSGYFVYGTTVGLVMADGSKLYLNLGTSSTSYKPLTFDTTATTTTWNLSGDTFRVGQLQNFLACSASGGYWDLYLQTGNDTPTGRTCANYITIHLPCLC